MKISVVSTTYNRKELLKECIESVQKTILNPIDKKVTFDHIVYDDGSTDGTPDLLKKNQYKNLTYIRSEENKGQSFGLNTSIDRSDADYIFVIDSDDILVQRTLHNFAEMALNNPEVDCFFADFLRGDDELRYLIGQDYYGWKFENEIEMLKSIFKGETFIQHSFFFKKKLYQEVGKYDESIVMAQDLDFFIRFLMHGVFPKYVNFISHIHRFHSSNLSKDETMDKHKNNLKRLYSKYNIKLKELKIPIPV